MASNIVVTSELTAAKQSMVDNLMEDFWDLFGREGFATVRQQHNSSTETSNSNSGSPPSATSQSIRNTTPLGEGNVKRRKKIDNGDDASDDDDDRNSKRPRNSPSSLTEKQNPRFACPYRKHKPQTYHIQNRLWRTCALNSFENIARLKYNIILTLHLTSNNLLGAISTATTESSNVHDVNLCSPTSQN